MDEPKKEKVWWCGLAGHACGGHARVAAAGLMGRQDEGGCRMKEEEMVKITSRRSRALVPCLLLMLLLPLLLCGCKVV